MRQKQAFPIASSISDHISLSPSSQSVILPHSAFKKRILCYIFGRVAKSGHIYAIKHTSPPLGSLFRKNRRA